MPQLMRDSTLEVNDLEALRLLEDERSRTRAGFSMGQQPFLGDIPDPGVDTVAPMSRPVSMPAASLKGIKLMVPLLAHLPDEYLASQSIDALIRANNAAKQADPTSSATGLEGKLCSNFAKVSAQVVELSGSDNRSSILHPGRFLGGAGVPVTKLWLEARRILGPSGVTPIANYDMAALGCSGCVTSKGWEILQNPGSSELALKLFTVANVSHLATGSKTVTLTGEEGITIHDTMKNIAELGELKMALRTLREAASLALPWNKSFSVLEGFLMTNEFFEKELEGRKKAMILTAFVDHVLKLNASHWIQELPFLSGGDLLATWSSWWGTRKFCASLGGDDATVAGGQTAGTGAGFQKGKFNKFNNRKGYNNSQQSGGQQGGQAAGQQGGQQSGQQGGQNGGQQGSQQSSYSSGQNYCRRYNAGNCPNPHNSCVIPNTNVKLYHLCNYRVRNQNGGTDYCGQRHVRVQNH
jgi:hypothetical protein